MFIHAPWLNCCIFSCFFFYCAKDSSTHRQERKEEKKCFTPEEKFSDMFAKNKCVYVLYANYVFVCLLLMILFLHFFRHFSLFLSQLFFVSLILAFAQLCSFLYAIWMLLLQYKIVFLNKFTIKRKCSRTHRNINEK